MNKVILSRLLAWVVSVQLVYLFLGGVVTYSLWLTGFAWIKPYLVHSISLVGICLIIPLFLMEGVRYPLAFVFAFAIGIQGIISIPNYGVTPVAVCVLQTIYPLAVCFVMRPDDAIMIWRRLLPFMVVISIASLVLSLFGLAIGKDNVALTLFGEKAVRIHDLTGIKVDNIGAFYRPSGIYHSNAEFGLIMLVFLCVALELRRFAPVYRYTSLVLVLALVNIVLSTSRTALLGAILVVTLRALFERSRHRRKRNLSVVVVFAGILIVVSIVANYFLPTIVGLGSLDSRLAFWTNVLPRYLNSPRYWLLGNGMGSVGATFSANSSFDAIGTYTDNGYLYLLFNMGIIGVALYVTILAKRLSFVYLATILTCTMFLDLPSLLSFMLPLLIFAACRWRTFNAAQPFEVRRFFVGAVQK